MTNACRGHRRSLFVIRSFGFDSSFGIAPAEGLAKRKGLLKNGLVRVPDVW